MISTIEIRSYKSIEKIELDLGRVNVFIGENGAGKSNILEAIALAGAASANKLDNEFLASRGIRVTQARQMRPAFEGFEGDESIVVRVGVGDSELVDFMLHNDNAPYSQWQSEINSKSDAMGLDSTDLRKLMSGFVKSNPTATREDLLKAVNDFGKLLVSQIKKSATASEEKAEQKLDGAAVHVELSENNLFARYLFDLTPYQAVSKEISNFIIYAPENTSLRTFQKEGQIEPLGINGEGLLKLLRVLSEEDASALNEIKSSLSLFGWFKDFSVVSELSSPSRMEITDRYLADGRVYFDQRSANEGFLYLAFYFALFSSQLTPKFFAIDNIDASLNPKLCQRLMTRLVELAERHDKQVILTTHNPAILDGLNLDDDSQRLFTISRNSIGYTKVRRVKKKDGNQGAPVRLSEMFMRGAIGGLPKGF